MGAGAQMAETGELRVIRQIAEGDLPVFLVVGDYGLPGGLLRERCVEAHRSLVRRALFAPDGPALYVYLQDPSGTLVVTHIQTDPAEDKTEEILAAFGSPIPEGLVFRAAAPFDLLE